jgi:hypothetical protein
LWAVAKADLGMSREEFLSTAPVELDAMMDRLKARRDDAQYFAAMVCASIFNVNCDWEKKPEGFSPLDFMPGHKKKDDDLEAFARECEENNFEHVPTEKDLELAEQFKTRVSKVFKVKTGEVRLVK